METEKFKMIWTAYPETEVLVLNGAGRGMAVFQKDDYLKKLFAGSTTIYVKGYIHELEGRRNFKILKRIK